MKTKTLSKELLPFAKEGKESSILEAVLRYGSNNKAAKKIDVYRRTVDRTINRIIRRAESEGYSLTDKAPKILVIDIENSPMQADLWSLWQNGVPAAQQVRRTYIISWAAKWLGDKNTMYDALCMSDDYKPGVENDERMLQGIWELLDEADFIVAHNGDNFDIKKLNTEFLLAGMVPPSPYRSIDTLKILKRTFKFDSNKLDYVLKQLFGYGKDETGGFSTWVGCMQGDKDAWDTMIKYNISDVEKLENLYMKIRAWDRLHPSAALYGGVKEVPVCTVCGSENVKEVKDKTAGTNVNLFPLWRCQEEDCGATMRGRKSILTQQQRATLLVKAKG